MNIQYTTIATPRYKHNISTKQLLITWNTIYIQYTILCYTIIYCTLLFLVVGCWFLVGGCVVLSVVGCLFCAALCCVVLYCVVLYRAVLIVFVLCCVLLCCVCIAFFCKLYIAFSLHCLFYSMYEHGTLNCVLHCVRYVVYCMLYIVFCHCMVATLYDYITLYYVTSRYSRWYTLHHVIIYYNAVALYCVVVHCSVCAWRCDEE